MQSATMAQNLLSVALVLVLLASATGAGSWILAHIQGTRSPLERVLFSTTIGMGIQGTVLLGLGSVGAIIPTVMWAAILGLGALGWKQFPDFFGQIRRASARGFGSQVSSGDVVWVILFLFAVVMIFGAFSPVTDWDSLMYHLEIPRQFVQVGRIHVPEDNLHVAYFGLFHFLFLPLVSVGGWAGPAILNASMAIFLALAVMAAGDRFFRREIGEAGAILLFGSTSVALVAATPRVDVSLALFLFLAHYGVVHAAESREKWGLFVGALLLGISVGVKYHALLYLTALSPVGLWALWKTSGGDWRALSRTLGICVVICAVLAAPWLLKNVVLLGGPFYPLFMDRVPPPWLAQIPGGVADSVLASPEIYQVMAAARNPFSLFDLFFSPGALTVEAEARSFSTNPAFLLLPISLLFIRVPGVVFFLGPALAFLFLLLVPREFTNLRYLIPVVPALTLVTVASVGMAVRKVVRGERVRKVLILGACLSLLPAVGGVRRELLTGDRVAAATGQISGEEFLSNAPVSGFPSYYSITRWVNGSLAPESRVLLLFEARGFYFSPEVLQDNILTNWPILLSTGGPDQCLEDTGITHVLVNHRAAAYYRVRGADLGDLDWQTFPRFVDRCLDLLHREGGYEVFRVRGVSGS